jgi:GPH family glycoside/pentoside/hexuronide:cation symporter
MNSTRPLTASTMIIYALPVAGQGFMLFLMNVYLLKYMTDVLAVAPVAIGLIMFASRVWDAVTDPLVGYFSDNTGKKMGRRRPWILASSIPMAGLFIMIWTPPETLSAHSLTLWAGVSIILFYTALTLFQIPHLSLGAELSDSYHVRTRVFGYRHWFEQFGFLLAVFALYFLFRSSDPRSLVFYVSLLAGLVTIATFVNLVVFIRERPDFQAKRDSSPFHSYRNVINNKYARRLMLVFFFYLIGMISASVYIPYVAEYIIGTPDKTSLFLLLFVISSISGVPLWIYLSQHFGKKNLWFFSMITIALAFASAFFLQEGSVVHMSLVLIGIGLGAGCSGVVGPSIQSDIIDYGECLTRKRTEGAYFAVWTFIQKSATGATFLVAGLVLEASGFVPNINQTETTKMWILGGFSIFPMSCYLLAAMIFKGFQLDEIQFRRIRKIIDHRRSRLHDGINI